MTFLQLYGVELDRELGSNSTTLFTTARRKAAINAAQLEFVRSTECLQRQVSVTLSDDTQEYDLDTSITDFGWIAKQGLSIKIVDGTTTTYIEGNDLTETSVERLNVEEQGWRAVTASRPTKYYLRRDGGAIYLGFHPKPSIDTETWTVIVPVVVIPADMSADDDLPFTVSANAVSALRMYHRALAYFGAADLEQFRKDLNRQAIQLKKFDGEVARYIGDQRPKGGQMVRFAKDYRGTARRGNLQRMDPRVFP